MLNFDFEDANGVKLSRGDYVVFNNKNTKTLYFGRVATGYMSSGYYPTLKVKVVGVNAYRQNDEWPNYWLDNVEKSCSILKITRDCVKDADRLDRCYQNFLEDPKCQKYCL